MASKKKPPVTDTVSLPAGYMTANQYSLAEGITRQAGNLRARRQGALTRPNGKPATLRDNWGRILVARDAVYTPGRPGRPAKTGK
jgi:hypothetical protein